jgi:hypothetical protein
MQDIPKNSVIEPKDNCASCGEIIERHFVWMLGRKLNKQEYYIKNGNYCKTCLERISSNCLKHYAENNELIQQLTLPRRFSYQGGNAENIGEEI